MLKKLLISLAFILFVFSLSAVKPRKGERQVVDNLLVNKNYVEAIQVLNKMLVKYPKDAEFNFMLGLCYFHSENDPSKAVDQFERSLKLAKKRVLILEIKYYLGRSYHVNAMFDKAIDVYNDLKAMISARNTRMAEDVDKLIETSLYAKKICADPVKLSVESLGEIVNSKFDDHSPCISADERYMVFTSRRKGKEDKKALDGQYFEDIYSSYFDGIEWVVPQRIDAFSSEGHDASVSMSEDGRTMLLFKSENGDKTSSGGDIYISYRMGKKWTSPAKLGGEINSDYRETHAAIAPDGQTIYFSSDRPGGLGGLDIYFCKKNDKQKWGKAVNIGNKINTKYDELSPFMHVDGETFYFSSNGGKTIGGLDIFSCIKKGDSWSTPKNLGYPINSLRDDLYFMPTPDGKRAYFASARKDGKGGLDLYLMKIEDAKARNIFVIRGAIGDTEADASFGDYSVIVKTEGKPNRTYRPDPVNGEYLFIIDANKDYRIDYVRDGYEIMQTIANIPIQYYNEVNHGVIPFKRIKLNRESGRYVSSDYSVDLPGCGFAKQDTLPTIQGKIAKLKILNLGVQKIVVVKPKIKLAPIVVPIPIKVHKQYTVQIKAMRRPFRRGYFRKIGIDIWRVKSNDNIYRYLYKKYDNLEDAKIDMLKMRDRSFFDAFVREFVDGKLGRGLEDSELMNVYSHVRQNCNMSQNYYGIQIKAMRNPLPISSFGRLSSSVSVVKGHDNIYRYIYKHFKSLNDARHEVVIIRRSSIRDAFIREIKNGQIGCAIGMH